MVRMFIMAHSKPRREGTLVPPCPQGARSDPVRCSFPPPGARVLIRLPVYLFVMAALSVFVMTATCVCMYADDAVISIATNVEVAAEDNVDDRTCYFAEAGRVRDNPVPNLELNTSVHPSLSWLLEVSQIRSITLPYYVRVSPKREAKDRAELSFIHRALARNITP